MMIKQEQFENLKEVISLIDKREQISGLAVLSALEKDLNTINDEHVNDNKKRVEQNNRDLQTSFVEMANKNRLIK